MARFLSPEWLAEMEETATGSEALRQAAAAMDVTVRHVVRDGPDGDVAYTVRLGGGKVSVVPDGGHADLEVTSDYPTAAAISQGRLSPAAAFASGRIKLGGPVGAITLLSGLGDVFAPLRAATEY